MSYYDPPYSHLQFDDLHGVHKSETDTTPEGNDKNVGVVDQNPNREQLYSGDASNIVRHPPPIPSPLRPWYDEERIALLLTSNRSESSSSSGRFGTWCHKYLNSSKKFVRSRKVNLVVSMFVFLGSMLFIGMGFGYMDKCDTTLSFPTFCSCIGGVGVMFALSNLMIMVESCRIRNRYNVFEWLTVGALLSFGILCAVALWRLTQTEFEPALAVENAYKCDIVFVTFFKISSAVGIVFTTVMAVVYLPLLLCCQSRCHCRRCC